jgi:hypothetical protein
MNQKTGPVGHGRQFGSGVTNLIFGSAKKRPHVGSHAKYPVWWSRADRYSYVWSRPEPGMNKGEERGEEMGGEERRGEKKRGEERRGEGLRPKSANR